MLKTILCLTVHTLTVAVPLSYPRVGQAPLVLVILIFIVRLVAAAAQLQSQLPQAWNKPNFYAYELVIL
jgi:hypothetical protein